MILWSKTFDLSIPDGEHIPSRSDPRRKSPTSKASESPRMSLLRIRLLTSRRAATSPERGVAKPPYTESLSALASATQPAAAAP